MTEFARGSGEAIPGRGTALQNLRDERASGPFRAGDGSSCYHLFSMRAARESLLSKADGGRWGVGLSVILPSIHLAGAPVSPGLKAQVLIVAFEALQDLSPLPEEL